MKRKVFSRGNGIFWSWHVRKNRILLRQEIRTVRDLNFHISKPMTFPIIAQKMYGRGPEAEG
jgi:hypothetical protein